MADGRHFITTIHRWDLMNNKRLGNKVSRGKKPSPHSLPACEHGISPQQISDNALQVVQRLNQSGYEAYLVGGAVRDLLLQHTPKDFDVATNARPEEVRRLFNKNCILIGRRFRLAHVRHGREITEVATFRKQNQTHHAQSQTHSGRILRDNTYGNMGDDVLRRDLTVNALFYDIRDDSVIDYFQGIKDIKARRIQVIGDPVTRYREDAVRMLRVLRFTAKLDFNLTDAVTAPILQLAYLLDAIPSARLFDEILKLFQTGHAVSSYILLRRYHLFGYLFGQTQKALDNDTDGSVDRFIRAGLDNTDCRVQAGKTIHPSYLYAFMLWGCLRQSTQGEVYDTQGLSENARKMIAIQFKQTSMPKHYTIKTQQIWSLQSRFTQRQGRRPYHLLTHRCFRAAYDFLLLRNQTGEELQALCDWWTDFQQDDEAKQLLATMSVNRKRQHTKSQRPRNRRYAKLPAPRH